MGGAECTCRRSSLATVWPEQTSTLYPRDSTAQKPTRTLRTNFHTLFSVWRGILKLQNLDKKLFYVASLKSNCYSKKEKIGSRERATSV